MILPITPYWSCPSDSPAYSTHSPTRSAFLPTKVYCSIQPPATLVIHIHSNCEGLLPRLSFLPSFHHQAWPHHTQHVSHFASVSSLPLLFPSFSLTASQAAFVWTNQSTHYHHYTAHTQRLVSRQAEQHCLPPSVKCDSHY